MSEEFASLVAHHTVPGTERVWLCRERGYWGKWSGCRIALGQLDDGRWWMHQREHELTGPERAEMHETYGEAIEAAREAMAALEPVLSAGGYIKFVELT